MLTTSAFSRARTTARLHRMPFGAEWRPGIGTRFALWAPDAASVRLCLEAPDRPSESIELPRRGEWFEQLVRHASPGTRYAFQVDGETPVADPASRWNPDGPHAASAVVDAGAYRWHETSWNGRPWEEAIIYELHVGAFTREGTFAAACDRLPYLADLGVTCVELMPVAQCPGRFNWGYDGVLLFAPDANYGTPDDLKRLVDAAHSHGLMVLLDVVYNHFGPDGNYLHTYAPQFFNSAHHTPWGAAINFDAEHSPTVREFYIHNALYWLEEYRFDGLRLDAVHRIMDDSSPDIVTELSSRVRKRFEDERHVHIVLENDHNQSRYLGRGAEGTPTIATAQWNDDIHHAAHVLVTGEVDGYYEDYRDDPLTHFGRCLAEGFAYQGEPSPHRQHQPRGEPSDALPPGAFVSFLQNHDQVGNRAMGDRLAAQADPRLLKLALACILLAPSPPMLFMGEEFAADSPFLYFCDMEGDLARSITEGRRAEFAHFERFRDPEARASIPSPTDPATFAACKLRWEETAQSPHREWLAYYKRLLSLRKRHVVPLLFESKGARVTFEVTQSLLCVDWRLKPGARLHLAANFDLRRRHSIERLPGVIFYASDAPEIAESGCTLGPLSVAWSIDRDGDNHVHAATSRHR